MAVAPITSVEVIRIIDSPKSVDTEVSWLVGANEVWAKADVPVTNSVGRRLRLVATASLVLDGRFSVSLLADGIRIRGLCVGRGHENKHPDDSRRSSGTHLHEWTDNCRDRVASPMEGISDKLDEAVKQFCDICKIQLSGSVAPLPAFQPDFGV